jgi:ribosomal protein S18 acetylase RimI-like enzyme
MFGLTPYVQQLVVGMDFQRMGLGKQLMNFVEEKYQNRFGISLLVNEDNLQARQFYKKLRYAEVGRIENYIKPGLHEIICFKQ